MKVIWATFGFNIAHLLPTLFDHLRTLDPQPDLYLFFENNSTDKTLEYFVNANLPAPHEVHRLWFAKDAVQLTNSYVPISLIQQTILARLRQLAPDFAIISATDVFPKTLDTIGTLTGWDADIVAAQVIRVFPEGMYISAKWKHPIADINPDYRNKFLVRKIHRMAYDDTPEMVGFGLVALKRSVLMDKRINFYPMTSSKEHGLASDDFGYCITAKKLGYTVALDGLVKADHVINDIRRETKPWTRLDNKDRTKGYVKFEYPDGSPEPIQVGAPIPSSKELKSMRAPQFKKLTRGLM